MNLVFFTRGSAVMLGYSADDTTPVVIYLARSIESADKALAHLETAMSPTQRQAVFNHMRAAGAIRVAWAANVNAAIYAREETEEQPYSTSS